MADWDLLRKSEKRNLVLFHYPASPESVKLLQHQLSLLCSSIYKPFPRKLLMVRVEVLVVRCCWLAWLEFGCFLQLFWLMFLLVVVSGLFWYFLSVTHPTPYPRCTCWPRWGRAAPGWRRRSARRTRRSPAQPSQSAPTVMILILSQTEFPVFSPAAHSSFSYYTQYETFISSSVHFQTWELWRVHRTCWWYGPVICLDLLGSC